MDEAERGLHDLLLERLVVDPAVDDRVAGLILAAWASDDDLAAALEGRPTPAADPTTPPPRDQQPDAYSRPCTSRASAASVSPPRCRCALALD